MTYHVAEVKQNRHTGECVHLFRTVTATHKPTDYEEHTEGTDIYVRHFDDEQTMIDFIDNLGKGEDENGIRWKVGEDI